MKHGQIEIKLPDGVKLEIGLTQENENGKLEIKENYCWIMTSQRNRMISMDSYNMGLSFLEKDRFLVFEDSFIDKENNAVRRLDVI